MNEYINLIIKLKDKDGFAWHKCIIELTPEEYEKIAKTLEILEADIPRLVFKVEQVKEISR